MKFLKRVYALTFSLLTCLGAITISQQSFAQEQEKLITDTHHKGGKVKLSGIVKDKQTNEAIPFVEVAAKTADSVLARAQTNFDGKFTLIIDTSTVVFDKIQIVFSFVGYKEDTLRTVEIPRDLLKQEVNVSLEAGSELPRVEVPPCYLTRSLEIEKHKKIKHKKEKRKKEE